MATFNALGVYDRALISTNDYSGVAWRSVATDGTNNFWGAGGGGGTVYLDDAAPHAVVQSAKSNCRVAEVFNGSLYMASGSVLGDGRTGIYKFSGLPKAAVGLPVPIIFTNTFAAPKGINDFAVNPSNSIIYFADDRVPAGVEGGIQRRDFDAGNNLWTNTYHLTNGLGNAGAVHLAVDWGGASPVLYATTGETTTGETSQNRLVKVTDAGPNSVFTTLATAGTNQVFKGVKFGPVL